MEHLAAMARVDIDGDVVDVDLAIRLDLTGLMRDTFTNPSGAWRVVCGGCLRICRPSCHVASMQWERSA